MKVLGLICARGGSKGIPRKNIKPLKGKPLIAYSIEAGLQSRSIDRLIVSTEDQEIADISKEYGADVPFIRPQELAEDTSLQIDAIRHAVEFVQGQGEEYDVICLLQPTCPLRTAEDIDGALALMQDQEADSVISITNVGAYHPLTMYIRDEQSQAVKPLMESDKAGVLRQNFQDVFWRNGAIYAMTTQVLMDKNALYGDKLCGYEIPAEHTVNLDDPLDWVMAEAFMDYSKKNTA